MTATSPSDYGDETVFVYRRRPTPIGGAATLSDITAPAAERGHTPPAETAGRTLRVALAIVRVGPVAILIVLFAVMTLLSSVFFTERNLQNLVMQTSVIAVLAVGQLLVIVTRGIDISVGSILGLSTITGGLAFGTAWGGSAVATILIMAGTGLAVGAVNGIAYVYGRMPNPLIITLATLGIARGLALIISGGDSVVGMPGLVVDLGSGLVGPVPWAGVFLLVVAGAASFLTRQTQWGAWIYAVGGNPEAAARVGMPVRRVLVSVYCLSGVCAGLAAVLVAGRTDSGFPQAGQLSELDAIAAVIIGGASILGGRGTVSGAVVGAFIIGTIRNGLNLLDVDPNWQLVTVGVVVALAVELDVIRAALERRFQAVQAGRGSAGASA
ncbi:MAG: inner-rane translocator [Conexibacter sp.]|nr:inner-rane translocator [Conexibacter sp.]